MRFTATAIDGVVRVELEPIHDERGFFARAWSEDEFAAAGIPTTWVHANIGHNPREGTLRGLHLQRAPHEEAKLVRCTRGRLQDVAVDLRADSPTYGRWVSSILTADNGEMLYVPPGCATGYLTLEPETDLFYQTSERFVPDSATGVRYDDPAFGIEWVRPILLVSAADGAWPYVDAT